MPPPNSVIAALLLFLLFGSGVLLPTATFATSNATAGEMVFTPCPSDVISYFRSYFPRYTEPASPSARRLNDEEEEEDDLDTLVFKRAQRKMGPFGPAPSATTQKRGKAGDDKETLPMPGARQPLFSETVGESAFLPSPNAWNDMRMAASGCTSCSNGCCDEVDIVLDCGRMRVPLNYSEETGRTISTMTYRVRLQGPLVPQNRSQLWLLQGGPGGSGLSILPFGVTSLEVATDIYIPDHRGTGLSSTLYCPSVVPNMGNIPPAQAAACVAAAVERDELEVERSVDPKHYATSNAARDLASAIESQRTAGVSITVHGYSYGTRWASRMLQMFPGIADKVVLEGNCDKDFVFNDFAAGTQYAGERFMEKCKLDAACNATVSMSLLHQQIAEVAAQGSTNPCTGLYFGSGTVTEDAVRRAVQALLSNSIKSGMDGPFTVSGSPTPVYIDYRTFYLTLVSRWMRCKEDRANLRVFAATLAYYTSLYGGYFGVIAVDSVELSSKLVYDQIVSGEMRRYPLESEAEYVARERATIWGAYNTYAFSKLYSDNWEPLRYARDEYMNLAPQNITAKVLIVNGEIDGQTSAPRAVKQFAEIGTENKRLAIIADEGHTVTERGCGRAVLKAFHADQVNALCGDFTDLAAPVTPLFTEFKITPLLAEQMIGNPPSPFIGDVAPNHCKYAWASPTSAIRYCRRCMDYCLLLVLTGDRGACECAQDYGACLQASNVTNSTDQCLGYVNVMGIKLGFAAFKTGGSCTPRCQVGVETGFYTTKQPTIPVTLTPTTLAPTTLAPTNAPTTLAPTNAPTTLAPTTLAPTNAPTLAPTTISPTRLPTHTPTYNPTLAPTLAPTMPTKRPTSKRPTRLPTSTPTKRPTSMKPTKLPTSTPTKRPTSMKPTKLPTSTPTKRPTSKKPTKLPTSTPTKRPTSKKPTKTPTSKPTRRTSFA